MKTQIIRLESHDDFVSVRDKMNRVQAPRILLVWPKGGIPTLNRRVDIVLIKRYAQTLGAQLAFVTRDSAIRFYARELNIPIYKSPEKAQEERWLKRRGRKENQAEYPLHPNELRESTEEIHVLAFEIGRSRLSWQTHLAARAVAVFLGLAALLAIAAVVFPTAEVNYVPRVIEQEVQFIALTSPSITTINAGGAIPTRQKNLSVSGETTVITTGSITLPDQSASGSVRFVNQTAELVNIPLGSIVITGNTPAIRYFTTRDAQVPPDPGAALDVPVQALEPGPRSNIPPGRIISTEGSLGLRVIVSNPLPITGGNQKTLPAPNQADRRRAFDELRSSLQSQAAEQVLGSLNPGDILLSPLPDLIDIQAENYFPADIVPSDVLVITMQMEFQAEIITLLDLNALGKAVMDASLPAGFNPVGAQLEVKTLAEPVKTEENGLEFLVHASRSIRSNPQLSMLIPKVLGQTPDTAQQLLFLSEYLSDPPEIRTSPTWWPRMPLLPIQIELVESSG